MNATPNRLHSPPMRVLCVLPSTSQMFSGIGRAVFAKARHLAGRMTYTFAIDDGFPRNTDLVRDFAREQGLEVHVGRAIWRDDSLDLDNDILPQLITEDCWDIIECLCWANASCNESILNHVGDRVLVYTPHDQPLTSVPMTPAQLGRTSAVHRLVMARADLVCCDSPHERERLLPLAKDHATCVYVPLGCDFDESHAIPRERLPQILFVGDLAERRKRFDRVLDLLERLRRNWPELRLQVIGNQPASAHELVPPSLRDVVNLRGYVSETELWQVYSESLAVVLLSEYEAFGMPILESLAVGTPVFLSEMETTRSLFGSYRGAIFCPAEDAELTAAVVSAALRRLPEIRDETIVDIPQLRAQFDWSVVARLGGDQMKAAWARRHLFALTT